MAEFCLKCWNEINGTDDPPGKYVMSEEENLCEGCGEMKRVIVTERRGGRGVWESPVFLRCMGIHAGTLCRGAAGGNGRRQRGHKREKKNGRE